MKKQNTIFLVLENLRSSENVGSIFRTADAIGVTKIYLCGYTPAPIDRFGRKNAKLIKASLGAEQSVGWEKYENSCEVLQEMKEKQVEIVVVEQDKRAQDYRSLARTSPVVFVFGNEVAGVSKDALERGDKIIQIPMRGEKESLNVAVSAGVVLYGCASIRLND